MQVVAQLQQSMFVHGTSEKKTKSDFWACDGISASTCLLVCLSFAKAAVWLGHNAISRLVDSVCCILWW